MQFLQLNVIAIMPANVNRRLIVEKMDFVARILISIAIISIVTVTQMESIPVIHTCVVTVKLAPQMVPMDVKTHMGDGTKGNVNTIVSPINLLVSIFNLCSSKIILYAPVIY